MFLLTIFAVLGPLFGLTPAHAQTNKAQPITIEDVRPVFAAPTTPARAPLAAFTLPSVPEPAPTRAPTTTKKPVPIPAPSAAVAKKPVPEPSQTTAQTPVPEVPFFSQFTDIASAKWQKVGCGITDLTMIVDYYHPGAASVATLLKKGIAAGAYDQNAGWIYQGLIDLSHEYGLDGTYHSLKGYDTDTALSKFKGYLAGGPVILSVHYKFDPKSTIPHLVVVNGIKDGVVYYNDPATTKGTKQISLADFLKGWTRNVIVLRPSSTS